MRLTTSPPSEPLRPAPAPHSPPIPFILTFIPPLPSSAACLPGPPTAPPALPIPTLSFLARGGPSFWGKQGVRRYRVFGGKGSSPHVPAARAPGTPHPPQQSRAQGGGTRPGEAAPPRRFGLQPHGDEGCPSPGRQPLVPPLSPPAPLSPLPSFLRTSLFSLHFMTFFFSVLSLRVTELVSIKRFLSLVSPSFSSCCSGSPCSPLHCLLPLAGSRGWEVAVGTPTAEPLCASAWGRSPTAPGSRTQLSSSSATFQDVLHCSFSLN